MIKYKESTVAEDCFYSNMWHHIIAYYDMNCKRKKERKGV